MKPLLVILGPPLCGKTVQSELIRRRLSISYLSTGVIFRDAIARGSELGLKIERIVEEGRLVPDDIVLATIDNALRGLQLDRGLLLDGFPRTISQVSFLEGFLNRKGAWLDNVIVLEVTEEEILKRLQKRRKEESRRDDESELAVRTRLEVYKLQTIPVISYYNKLGVATHINGNRPIQQVFNEISLSLGIKE